MLNLGGNISAFEPLAKTQYLTDANTKNLDASSTFFVIYAGGSSASPHPHFTNIIWFIFFPFYNGNFTPFIIRYKVATGLVLARYLFLIAFP